MSRMGDVAKSEVSNGPKQPVNPDLNGDEHCHAGW